jgi:hypothetical protein
VYHVYQRHNGMVHYHAVFGPQGLVQLFMQARVMLPLVLGRDGAYPESAAALSYEDARGPRPHARPPALGAAPRVAFGVVSDTYIPPNESRLAVAWYRALLGSEPAFAAVDDVVGAPWVSASPASVCYPINLYDARHAVAPECAAEIQQLREALVEALDGAGTNCSADDEAAGAHGGATLPPVAANLTGGPTASAGGNRSAALLDASAAAASDPLRGLTALIDLRPGCVDAFERFRGIRPAILDAITGLLRGAAVAVTQRRMEDSGVDAQWRALRAADVLVCSEGAGMANMLVSKNGSTWVMVYDHWRAQDWLHVGFHTPVARALPHTRLIVYNVFYGEAPPMADLARALRQPWRPGVAFVGAEPNGRQTPVREQLYKLEAERKKAADADALKAANGVRCDVFNRPTWKKAK